MNTITRVATVIGMTGMLLGCATTAQRQFQTIATNTRSASQTFQACVLALYNSPEVEPLRADLPSDPNRATLAQLANRNFATDVEVRTILENHPKLQVCRRAFLDQISQTTPAFVPIFLATETSADNETINLIQKKIAWGEFLQRWKAISVEGTARLLAEDQRIVAGLEASHEAELARRQAAIQAAADALARYGQTQQIIGNMNRPVNCITMTIRPGFQNTSCQ
jgi:hypothetical protein